MRTLSWITALVLLVLPGCARTSQEVAQPAEAPPSPVAPTDIATTAPPAPTPPASQAPSPTPSAVATTPPAPESGRDVELWFVRDGEYLLEPEVHRSSGLTQAVARETMELLVETSPRDPGLFTVIPEDTQVLGVSLKDGDLTVDVDFPGHGPNVGAGFEGALYDQIVHTGAQFPTVDRVRVLEEGKTPRTGHAVELDKPRAPREEAVAPVVIMQPAHDEHVAGGDVTVAGTANVYEATVMLRLVDPDGQTTEKTFATATCGTGCRGTWKHTFSAATPGEWTVIAAASDPSDGEGPPPYRTKRTFVVD